MRDFTLPANSGDEGLPADLMVEGWRGGIDRLPSLTPKDSVRCEIAP